MFKPFSFISTSSTNISSKKAVALVSGVLFLAGCGDSTQEVKEVVRPVNTVVVSLSALGENRTYPGKVQASDKVDLSFQVSGPLVEFPVNNGQEVEKGQLLARIDDRDFKSRLKASEAQYAKAKADLDRAKPLVAKRLISKSQVDNFQAAFDVAGADLELARKALSDTNLKAPFSGVVASTFVENFQDVQAKQIVLSLQDNSNLEVVVNIPEKTLLTSRREDLVAIETKFEAMPSQVFNSEIKEFATEADPDTQTYEVVLSIENTQNLNVLPGMSASVTAYRKNSDVSLNVIKLPAASVFADPSGAEGRYVWRVKDNNTVVRKQVEVGMLSGSDIVVTKGLSEGERVVTAGVHYLVEGQAVKLIDGQ